MHRILERFLLRFEIVKLSEAISDRAVDLLCTYRLSHGLLIPDALIAATALSIDAPLLSKNQRDYRFIQDLNLLPDYTKSVIGLITRLLAVAAWACL